MKIKGLHGMTTGQLRTQVAQGGKFVFYKYCISIVVLSFNNPSSIYYIPPGRSRVVPGLGYLCCNFFLGWWGIPHGLINTIGNIATILGGGKDVTAEVMAQINQNDPDYGTGTTYNIPGQGSASATTEAAPAYNIPAH